MNNFGKHIYEVFPYVQWNIFSKYWAWHSKLRLWLDQLSIVCCSLAQPAPDWKSFVWANKQQTMEKWSSDSLNLHCLLSNPKKYWMGLTLLDSKLLWNVFSWKFFFLQNILPACASPPQPAPAPTPPRPPPPTASGPCRGPGPRSSPVVSILSKLSKN